MVSADKAAEVISNGPHRLRCNVPTAEYPNFNNIFCMFLHFNNFDIFSSYSCLTNYLGFRQLKLPN